MPKKETDKRQHRRVNTEMPIQFRVIDGQGELAGQQRSKTTNIAVRGVAFISPLNIPIEARVEIEITLPGGAGELACQAIVMRIVRELPADQGIEYGVQFDMDTLKRPEMLDEFVKSIDIVPLLERMLKADATDLHLSADTPPVFRVNRKLVTADRKPLKAELVEAMVLGTLSPDRRAQFYREKEVYYPFVMPGLGRWRAAAYYQRGHIEATFHAINLYVPTITELGLPEVLNNLALGRGGLICVTGGAASGKSTTIAAMVRAINQTTDRVIVTVENPIQYIHQNDRSVIKQREVGSDCVGVREAIRSVVRQDPDVIVVDEVPDAESMDILLRAAESGRLVITSWSSPDAASTVRRLLGMYPQERRAPVLHAFASSVRGFISQRLLPSVDGTELIMIPEIVVVNESIRQAIWTDKLEQISTFMMNQPGSIALDASLRNAIIRGQIEVDSAALVARDPDNLRRTIAV